MSSAQTIFKKLTIHEKKRLMEEIHSKSLPLFFKFEKTLVFKIKVIPGRSGESFFGAKPEELHSLFDGHQATVVAAVQGERYFFSTHVYIEKERIRFDLSMDVYRLQRRKHKRFNIPETYPAFISVKRLDGQVCFFKSRVFDISEGGMRIGLPTDLPQIQQSQIILGTLRLDERKGIEVRTYVRHVKKSSDSNYKQIIGLEFQDVSSYTKALISNQILDLQRDLFNYLEQKK